MDKPKHTPGPWRVMSADTVVGPTGNVVCECMGYSVHATDPAQVAQGGREANATLIAAAPELLVMLRRFYAVTYGCESQTQLSALDFEQARNAIRKATGEE